MRRIPLTIAASLSLIPRFLTVPTAVRAQTTEELIDPRVVSQYNLTIPETPKSLQPAPDWVLGVDMANEWGRLVGGFPQKYVTAKVTRNYVDRDGRRAIQENELKKTVWSPEGRLDPARVKGIPLLINVPHVKEAIDQAHAAGVKVIPYVHFMCTNIDHEDQGVFIWQHPEILLKDEDGRWRNTYMDGTYRLHRFLVCANNPSYWKLMEAYVRKLLEMGVDGLFIDNVHTHRDDCYAPRITIFNPETGAYRHDHIFPWATNDFAFDKFLQMIAAVVKSYGPDRIVVLNSGIGTPFEKNGDMCMWESFIYSWAWKGRQASWEDVKASAAANAWYTDAGRRILALSYLGNTEQTVKDDAYWAYVAAHLVGFVWSDYGTIGENEARALYDVHLGHALEPLREENGVASRAFEGGVLVLNNSLDEPQVTVAIPTGAAYKSLTDLYSGRKVRAGQAGLTVRVPRLSARVYRAAERQQEAERGLLGGLDHGVDHPSKDGRLDYPGDLRQHHQEQDQGDAVPMLADDIPHEQQEVLFGSLAPY